MVNGTQLVDRSIVVTIVPGDAAYGSEQTVTVLDTSPPRARVLATVDLKLVSPAYRQLLAASGQDDDAVRRSTMMIIELEGTRGDGPTLAPASSPPTPLAMGDSLTIGPAFPFPNLLERKFESKYTATVSCIIPPMVLLDASVAVGGLEGAPLCIENETVGVLGEAVSQSINGTRWIVGWDLSSIDDYLGTQLAGNETGTSEMDTSQRRGRQLSPPAPCPLGSRSSIHGGLSRLVSVHVDNTFATGFVIGCRGSDNIICTNAHVVPKRLNGRPVQVRHTIDGRVLGAIRWASFEGTLDLAFLLVPDLHDTRDTHDMYDMRIQPWSAKSTVPSTREQLIGRPIFSLGFPGTFNPLHRSPLAGPKLASGRVTSVLNDDMGACCFTTDARIVDGNSGSPIIDARDGRLVGMASSNAVIVSTDLPRPRTYHPELNFCIPGTLIQETLEQCLAEGPGWAHRSLAARKIDRLVSGASSKL